MRKGSFNFISAVDMKKMTKIVIKFSFEPLFAVKMVILTKIQTKKGDGIQCSLEEKRIKMEK